MSNDLGGGGGGGSARTDTLEPFAEHPADPSDLRSTGISLSLQGSQLLDFDALRQVARRPALAGWHGLASEELADMDQPIRQGAVDTSGSLVWTGSVVKHWADVVSDFNDEVRRIIEDRESEISAADDLLVETPRPPTGTTTTTTPGSSSSDTPTMPTPESVEARDAAVADARDTAVQRWHQAHTILLDGRDQVVRMLSEGPTAENVRMLRSQGMVTDVMTGVFQTYPDSLSDEITVLDLNAAAGAGNGYRNGDGMDPGDIDELARRIIAGDADVATLQEMYQMDITELEEHLEEMTGDEWDMHFVEASQKYRAHDGLAPIGYANQPFGNVIAVRRGEGVAYSELAGTEKLDGSGDDWDGSDGRSAISVQVHTTNGGTVDIATSHTDTSNDIEDPELRAQEIEQTRELAESTADGGPVIVTGDFNNTRQTDGAPGEVLNDFVDDGYTDAGGAVGPTSGYGHSRPIDFVFTSDEIGVSDPDRVQGDSPDHEGEDHDLSDHDGIAVDVSVPIDANAQPVSADEIPEGGDFDGSGDYSPDDDID